MNTRPQFSRGLLFTATLATVLYVIFGLLIPVCNAVAEVCF